MTRTNKSFNDRINELFRGEEWEKARTLLEKALEKEPDSHWLITQLGVTFYEQRQYARSLALFTKSLEIIDDCPLTLWNFAGALEMLDRPKEAMIAFAGLLASKVSPKKDPCWESEAWTIALKTDVLYRIGGCFASLGKKRHAEECYRQYLELQLMGIKGSYSIEDVTRRIQGLQGPGNGRTSRGRAKQVFESTLHAPGLKPYLGSRSAPSSSKPKRRRAQSRAVNPS